VQGAIDHLTIALSIDPSFVAAHTALGSAYMGLGRSDQARAEFARLARYFGTSEQFWLAPTIKPFTLTTTSTISRHVRIRWEDRKPTFSTSSTISRVSPTVAANSQPISMTASIGALLPATERCPDRLTKALSITTTMAAIVLQRSLIPLPGRSPRFSMASTG
jgi:tetratricopeptide (TPR) repeat protein